MALPRKPGREAGSRPLSAGVGWFAQEGTTWKEPHGENHPQLRYVPPGRHPVNPFGVGLRPRSRVTGRRLRRRCAGYVRLAPEGGFEGGVRSRRSRDLLAHMARLGGAVTEGEPRSG